jgi:hypothetical protein
MTTSQTPAATATRGNGVAVSGFVGSLVGTVLGLLSPILFYLLPLALGAIGRVLSGIGFARPRQSGRSGKGLAIAGVVLGVIALVLGIVGAVALNEVANPLGS